MCIDKFIFFLRSGRRLTRLPLIICRRPLWKWNKNEISPSKIMRKKYDFNQRWDGKNFDCIPPVIQRIQSRKSPWNCCKTLGYITNSGRRIKRSGSVWVCSPQKLKIRCRGQSWLILFIQIRFYLLIFGNRCTCYALFCIILGFQGNWSWRSIVGTKLFIHSGTQDIHLGFFQRRKSSHTKVIFGNADVWIRKRNSSIATSFTTPA